jgi:hypothetical protein
VYGERIVFLGAELLHNKWCVARCVIAVQRPLSLARGAPPPPSCIAKPLQNLYAERASNDLSRWHILIVHKPSISNNSGIFLIDHLELFDYSWTPKIILKVGQYIKTQKKLPTMQMLLTSGMWHGSIPYLNHYLYDITSWVQTAVHTQYNKKSIKMIAPSSHWNWSVTAELMALVLETDVLDSAQCVTYVLTAFPFTGLSWSRHRSTTLTVSGRKWSVISNKGTRDCTLHLGQGTIKYALLTFCKLALNPTKIRIELRLISVPSKILHVYIYIYIYIYTLFK